MKYSKYPSYRDSGVEWLGEIPCEWSIKQIKHIGQTIPGGTPSTTVEEYWNGDVPWLPSGTVQNSIIMPKDTPKYITKKGLYNSATKYLYKDTVMVALTGATCSNIGYLTFQATANQSVVGINTSKATDSKYLFYTLMSQKSQILVQRTGGAQSGINDQNVRNLKITYPPLQEQQTIANYLDKATAKIDTLIEKQTKLIELLREKRQAVISTAVTRGLDNRVTMKDSGVEWLGEIPEHWEVSKLRYIFSFGKGLTITKANLQDKGISCVNYGEIHSKYGFEVDTNKHALKCVDASFLDDSKSSLLSRGDFVFADTSEDIEGAGNFTHVISETQIFAGYHTIIARQIAQNNFRFLAYLIDSVVFRTQIRIAVKGVKVFSITQAILKASIVWFPNMIEQQAIADYLDDKTSKIDTLVIKSTKAIDLLKEKRTALISAAVTGKIDVREIA